FQRKEQAVTRRGGQAKNAGPSPYPLFRRHSAPLTPTDRESQRAISRSASEVGILLRNFH
ncbi:MAG TPA: hypothetical protein VFA10_25190, partial [Ktedonobacteraceae bacterium]|nr:hypothetical protein [Ktedonobacteraceae bacterium]